jgi:hypothetical protein
MSIEPRRAAPMPIRTGLMNNTPSPCRGQIKVAHVVSRSRPVSSLSKLCSRRTGLNGHAAQAAQIATELDQTLPHSLETSLFSAFIAPEQVR